MAIIRIGASAIEATSITLPGSYQNGDYALIYAFRTATTAPTLPAGWTSLNTNSSGATSFTCGYKKLISASDVSGTWTNATGLICNVYRGLSTIRTPISSGVGNQTATSSTINYQALTMAQKNQAWIVAFAAIVATTSTIITPPTNLTNAVDLVGSTVEYVSHDSNGVFPGSGIWPTTTVSVGVSGEWRSIVVEIMSEQLNIENYKFVKVGDGMSASEKIR